MGARRIPRRFGMLASDLTQCQYLHMENSIPRHIRVIPALFSSGYRAFPRNSEEKLQISHRVFRPLGVTQGSPKGSSKYCLNARSECRNGFSGSELSSPVTPRVIRCFKPLYDELTTPEYRCLGI